MIPPDHNLTLQEIVSRGKRSPRGKLSSWRILAQTLVQAAGGYDQLIKKMYLEGVAGVTPMSWAGRRGTESEIEKALGPKAVDLLKKGPEIYTQIRRAVEKFVPSGASLTADDIIQQAVMGLGTNNEPTRDYLFHAVGQRAQKKKVLDGQIDWKRDVANPAVGFLKNRVRDVMRAMKRDRARSAPLVVRTDDGPKEIEPPSFSDLSKENQMALALHMLSDRGNSGLRTVQDWMAKKIKEHGQRRKSDEKIFLALLENIEGKTNKSQSQMAKDLGVSSPHIAQAKRRIGKFLAEELAKNPRIMAPVWKAIELSQLGYGASPLGARSARVNSLVLRFFFRCAKEFTG